MEKGDKKVLLFHKKSREQISFLNFDQKSFQLKIIFSEKNNENLVTTIIRRRQVGKLTKVFNWQFGKNNLVTLRIKYLNNNAQIFKKF